jgi:hypothetical protein
LLERALPEPASLAGSARVALFWSFGVAAELLASSLLSLAPLLAWPRLPRAPLLPLLLLPPDEDFEDAMARSSCLMHEPTHRAPLKAFNLEARGGRAVGAGDRPV